MFLLRWLTWKREAASSRPITAPTNKMAILMRAVGIGRMLGNLAHYHDERRN